MSLSAIEVEKSILGGILLENSQFHEVSHMLKAEDFSLDSHRIIWLAMVELAAGSKPIDIVLLVENLGNSRKLERVGDVGYISSLIDGVPDRPSLLQYAKVVKDAAIRRALYSVSVSLGAKVSDSSEPTSAILSHMRQSIDAMSESCRSFADSVPLFDSYPKFEQKAVGSIEWTVDRLIQRGANGLILAGPKSGKSLCVADLAIALASGQEWLGFSIPKRIRTAIVSREDYFALTHSRMKRYREARQLYAEELEDFLFINARGAAPAIKLDRPDDVAALIGNLKKNKTEFLILDVMRVLHSAEENDSTEVQREVIDPLNRISDSVGCSICMLHHSTKDQSLKASANARGTSAIFGWAEFSMGIRMEDEDTDTRLLEFEIKAGAKPGAFYWRACDLPGGALKLERVEWTPKRGRKNQQEAPPF